MKIKVSKKIILRGFTLIELLVVIAIIGILSSVVLASLSNARIKAQDAARISSTKSLKTALELYYLDKGYYPNPQTAALGAVIDSILINALVPTYIGSMPAILLADRDQYTAESVNSNSNIYALLIVTSRGTCKTGVDIPVGWWQEFPTCDF